MGSINQKKSCVVIGFCIAFPMVHACVCHCQILGNIHVRVSRSGWGLGFGSVRVLSSLLLGRSGFMMRFCSNVFEYLSSGSYVQLIDVGNRYICSLSTAMSFKSRKTNIDRIEQAVRSMRALAFTHAQYEGFVVEAIMNPSPDAVFTDSSFCHRSCLMWPRSPRIWHDSLIIVHPPCEATHAVPNTRSSGLDTFGALSAY